MNEQDCAGPRFVVKDSGKREEFESGMVRDTEDEKVDYTLVLDGPMVVRWAEHLTKGAKKYTARNWMMASGEEEEARFVRSAFRHMIQWMRGDRDEDHAAAVFFNINGAEYVRQLSRFLPILEAALDDLGCRPADTGHVDEQ